MKGLLLLLTLIICLLIIFFLPYFTVDEPSLTVFGVDYAPLTPYSAGKAVLLCATLSGVAGFLTYKRKEHGGFLLKLFVSALLIRVVVAMVVHLFRWQEFFGGDALTYDFYGQAQLQGWLGDSYYRAVAKVFVGDETGSGWGMVYLVAAIYGLIGRNMLAVQLVNCVFGAATAVIIFLCAQQVFNNVSVARIAAIAVAFFPSLVLWSSQGLKDGPIVFLLAMSILATLRLGQKLTLKYVAVLICSLLALLSFRFYVFYMICVAIGGAFLIGMQEITTKSFVRQFGVIVLLGLALTYVGITRSASIQFQEYGNLARIQRSRLDLAQSAKSGFGRDIDVSSAQGALTTIPMGLVYLLFAPFPWQLVNLRQSITLPEMVIWWASFPLLVLGLWFAVKYRLRMISPILIFTVLLTLAYSLFQGNVGTAYRQRAQLLIFYFIFVAVGFVLLKEKREDRERKRQLQARRYQHKTGSLLDPPL
jgi:Dolichyl-phosphate-mannose-protein mannosyltransferase